MYMLLGLILIICWIIDAAEGTRPMQYRPHTEEDMSPMIAVLMFDDYMSDGGLDLF